MLGNIAKVLALVVLAAVAGRCLEFLALPSLRHSYFSDLGLGAAAAVVAAYVVQRNNNDIEAGKWLRKGQKLAETVPTTAIVQHLFHFSIFSTM